MPSRILVVDDDARVARPLIEVLAYQGHDVNHADSGEDALDRLGAERFDLVLLDVRLPGLSGFETCARIRERHGPALPVLMLTAFPDHDLVRARLRGGGGRLPAASRWTLRTSSSRSRPACASRSLHDEMDGHREVAQARARDLARLHEIGRDWSLIAEPGGVQPHGDRAAGRAHRRAHLPARPLRPGHAQHGAALPVHGLPDEIARKMRYVVRPEYRAVVEHPQRARRTSATAPGRTRA